ncbi:MAG: hypothetical protein OIF47_06505 [Marinibacterium sp.]|nr:hypothetical protein [Marinibacterium sp.]
MIADALSALMMLIPAGWTVAHLLASRAYELFANWATARGDADAAVNLAQKARNAQDFSRIMPTWLLIIFALGVLWRLALLIGTLIAPDTQAACA